MPPNRPSNPREEGTQSLRPLLATRGLWKSFAAPVLADVSLEFLPGEIHALVGENGAGKSTFCRIVAGLLKPDRGTMLLEDAPYRPRSRKEAERLGVSMVTQELNLVPTLTVAENLFLDELPHRWGVIRRRELRDRAAALLKRLGFEGIAPEAPAGKLGVGEQQLIEIAAGLRRPCRVLILDEPTAALTDREAEALWRQTRALRSEGAAVALVSHKLEEVLRVADWVSVLRDGKLVGTRKAKETDPSELTRMMAGREPARTAGPSGKKGPVRLRVEGLRAGSRVRDVNFHVRAGEILGVAGLMGSGRTETARAVFGADPKEAGRIFLGSEDKPTPIRSPAEARRLGLALAVEDRKAQGLLLPLPVRVNITLNSLRRMAKALGVIDRRGEKTQAEEWIRRLGVRCASPEQPIQELSGGNQQKAMIARWLLHDAKVFLFDEPTRGIDVGAKFEIHNLLRDLAARGKAVVMISSELEELLALADRIVVIASGRTVADIPRGAFSTERIMEAAFQAAAEGSEPQGTR